MRVNFKNEKGIACTRESFIKRTPKITIPEVTQEFDKARERLAEMKAVDLEKAAMIVAAGWDDEFNKRTYREHIYELSLAFWGTGELQWEGTIACVQEKPVFTAFKDCLKARIEAQQQIVDSLNTTYNEIEE